MVLFYTQHTIFKLSQPRDVTKSSNSEEDMKNRSY